MLKVQALLGIFVFLCLAYALSENKKKAFSLKLIVSCLGLQLLIGAIFQKFIWVQEVLLWLNHGVVLIDTATKKGSSFLFGYLAGGGLPFNSINNNATFIIAFQVLPIVIVVSALSRVLFHWGILQRIIYVLSISLEKILKLDALSCFSVASSFFFGIIETPLLLKAYLLKMSRAQLFVMFVACMSTISGTVMILYANVLQAVLSNPTGHIVTASLMSLPASILFASIMIPFDSQQINQSKIQVKTDTQSALEALVEGSIEGIQMVFYIVAVIIVFFACIHIVNAGLSVLNIIGLNLSLETLFAYIFYPFCWLMGIGQSDCWQGALLMSNKLLLNEFVAFSQMAAMPKESLKESSYIVLTYALCGFANLGSLGILTAGISQIFKDKTQDVLDLAPKAVLAGTLSTMTTGAMVALFI